MSTFILAVFNDYETAEGCAWCWFETDSLQIESS